MTSYLDFAGSRISGCVRASDHNAIEGRILGSFDIRARSVTRISRTLLGEQMDEITGTLQRNYVQMAPTYEVLQCVAIYIERTVRNRKAPEDLHRG